MKKAEKVLGWHFTDGMKLRDGQPLKVGKTYKYEGDLERCAKGYHAGVDIVDALYYAPGFQVSRVECSGDMEHQSDKLVCRNRKVLWTMDAKAIILKWSIRVATDAVKMVRKTSTDKAWNAWADLWISGKDRTNSAASAANSAASAAAYAANSAASAANAAAAAYAYAAYAYAYAANAAAYAPNAAYAAKKKYSGWLVAMIEKERGKPW